MIKVLNRLIGILLEITVFVCGAVVMIFELAGSRVLGPYLGTSLYVWSGLIGVILGSLSLGYWLGGRLADRRADWRGLASLIFVSGLLVSLSASIKDIVMAGVENFDFSEMTLAVVASLILFAPASVLLGMVSPYAIKLKINVPARFGRTVGNLYAVSTFGSIAGTFGAGYYFLPFFGTTEVLYLLAAILIVNSILLCINFRHLRSAPVIFLTGLFFVLWPAYHPLRLNNVIDTDTRYNRVWIYEYIDQKTNEPVRALKTDRYGVQSAMFLNSDELVHEYTKYYRLAGYFKPGLASALMLGGCAYSYPRDFLKKNPAATMDVVEIDPAMTMLAKKYFRLEDDPRLTTYNEDARVFLNKTEKKYDVIFGDAFNSFSSIPYQLTTVEAVKKEYDALNENGLVIVNIISSIINPTGNFLRAEYKTYKKVFPQVYIFPVQYADFGNLVQNIILVALKSDIKPSLRSSDPELDGYLKHIWSNPITGDMPILTDNYAPVDYYHYLLAKSLL